MEVSTNLKPIKQIKYAQTQSHHFFSFPHTHTHKFFPNLQPQAQASAHRSPHFLKVPAA